MTDNDSSDQADADSGPEDTGTDNPGGGPTRVVSSQSVDDILDSLESTSQLDRSASRPDDLDHEAKTESSAGASPTSPRESERGGADERPVESEDAASEGLSDRVDAGTVTGADVRAAEAGEGRERTPEVDEIDLSLEDLEASTDSESGGESTGAEAGAAPADETGSPSSALDTDSRNAESSPGLLGRLVRLFSR